MFRRFSAEDGFRSFRKNLKVNLMLQYLNLEKIRQSQLIKEPYPFTIIESCIHPEKLTEICKDFPPITQGGSFPLSHITCVGGFANFIKELQSDDFRNCLAEKFTMDLQDKPSVITVRGYSRTKEGQVHTDSKSKLITVLFYFNQTWTEQGGRLRVLNSNRLDDYKAEIAPLAGNCLIFKVTDNCWHGHLPFIGSRRSIQFNFVTNESAAGSHLLRHRLSAKLKSWFNINHACIAR